MTQRRNHRVSVFFSNQDRVLHLELLATHFARQRIDLIGRCLMTNHVHQLVIPRRPESLAFGIGCAHQKYSRWLQIRRRQTGQRFQNRFHRSPLDHAHTWQAILYTPPNPVRADLRGRSGFQGIHDWHPPRGEMVIREAATAEGVGVGTRPGLPFLHILECPTGYPSVSG
ncbi:MAG: transposase [Bryobacterales bacterium]|nr:transposase [Bryobacterales bacterium]